MKISYKKASSELIVKYNIGLKLLCNSTYHNLYFMVIKVINSKELLENLILVIDSKRLSNVIKKSWIYLGIMRQSACLVVNLIAVYSYCFLFVLCKGRLTC